jgi:hypothetical protein
MRPSCRCRVERAPFKAQLAGGLRTTKEVDVPGTPQRDLSSVELWQASLERSRRRRAVARSHRRRPPKALVGVLSVAALAIAAPAAMADNPPGLLGYEGQPGNQGDQNGGTPAPGLLGYEGQPGNQGGLPPGP